MPKRLVLQGTTLGIPAVWSPTMLLAIASLALIASLPWQVVGAGQIPEVNGVLGGVPSSPANGTATTRILITDPITSGVTTTLPPDTTTEPTYTTTLDPVTETDTADDTTTSLTTTMASATLTSAITGAAAPPVGVVRIIENSGICETTRGVYQASGYIDLSPIEHMWFWFFGARKNPKNAPLVLWFNGGPGSSSMVGLFQENGPCRIKDDSSTVTNNPYSWNEEANVLYIDQPIGTGFSYGNLNVDTSQRAAQDVWRFLQIFLSDRRFSQYSKRPLAIWTESYGGHYGPTFAAYFLEQNSRIRAHLIKGTILRLSALGIGNGLTDPLSQYPEYLSYAASNPYNNPLVPQARITAIASDLTSCESRIASCNAPGGTNMVCSDAQDFCNAKILSPLINGWDVYDVRHTFPDPYPPDFTTYINSIRTSIGAAKIWSITNYQVYDNFAVTGDWMRSSRPLLEQVINAGVRTLIFAGDADYIVNYKGVEAMVANLRTRFSADYNTKPWLPYRVRGITTGQYKQAGTFAYLRVYGAGHEVPAYGFSLLARGEAALQFFNQITFNHPLSSTN